MNRIKIMTVLTLMVLIVNFSCSPKLPTILPEDQTREALLAATLTDAAYQPGVPVHNGYFTPLAGSEAALHTFSGTLQITEFKMQADSPDGAPRSDNRRYFPGFMVEFFTFGDDLVPANREIIPSTGSKSYWSILLSPGKIWSEPGDHGMSRAAFPFTLVGQDYNSAQNGLATFLFDDESVSQFYFQITQETASWNQSDYWGQSELIYQPHSLENESAMQSQFSAELAAQFPIKPWEDLEPEIDEKFLDNFTGGLEPTDISLTGLIRDETIYLQEPLTRTGAYPFPRSMRHGVFSVTKSMGAAVAMLRLAQKYGDDVFNLKISDYVDVTAAHDGWDEVTFGDALSMATGTGDTEKNPVSSYVTADEDQAKFSRWMESDSAAEKLALAFEYGNHSWGPGEVVRYNSINTFVLSAAMDAFLKSKAGPEADIWQMVVEDVYQPIGIFHAPIMRTHEADGSLGLPIFGYGLYPTVDDTAKVATLLQNGGKHNEEQLLSASKLAEALYQTEEQGLSVYQPNQFGETRYLLSFWSVAHCEPADTCYQIPYMMGYGGNLVILLPNKVTVFRYADAHNYDTRPLIEVGLAINPGNPGAE